MGRVGLGFVIAGREHVHGQVCGRIWGDIGELPQTNRASPEGLVLHRRGLVIVSLDQLLDRLFVLLGPLEMLLVEAATLVVRPLDSATKLSKRLQLYGMGIAEVG